MSLVTNNVLIRELSFSRAVTQVKCQPISRQPCPNTSSPGHYFSFLSKCKSWEVQLPSQRVFWSCLGRHIPMAAPTSHQAPFLLDCVQTGSLTQVVPTTCPYSPHVFPTSYPAPMLIAWEDWPKPWISESVYSRLLFLALLQMTLSYLVDTVSGPLLYSWILI